MKPPVVNLDRSHMEFDYDFVSKIISKLKLEDNLEVRKDIKSILVEAKEIILEKYKSEESSSKDIFTREHKSFLPSQEQIDAMKTIEDLTNQQNWRLKSGGLPASNPPNPNKPKKNK